MSGAAPGEPDGPADQQHHDQETGRGRDEPARVRQPAEEHSQHSRRGGGEQLSP
ncbi:hypothetical protein ACFPN7_10040 [Amycolatopsis halotolerans]|uniref:hypothetical protein n=1 Tax=Amycolatopsis halotolerans TaxID=330083 RepID=UPI003622B090